MTTHELCVGDWVIAPFPLKAGDVSHTSIFKVDKVKGSLVFTKRGRAFVEIEARRLAACSVRRGDIRMIYRPPAVRP